MKRSSSTRFDAVGFFWEEKVDPTTKRQIGPMPPIPETGWRAPESFPNLSAAKVISFDTETKDLNMKTHGPGWARGDQEIIGISMSVEDGSSWYFPFGHEACPEQNMDKNQVLRWADHTLNTSIPKVGANLIYDVGTLKEAGVEVDGPLYDVQFAEALLNSEAPRVALDSLAMQYLNVGKETSLLYQWLADWMGGDATDAQRKHIWRAPASLAGPYAEADAALPLAVLNRQWPLLHRRGVMDLFEVECGLIPMLVAMRFQGAPTHVPTAHIKYDELDARINIHQKEMNHIAGMEVNVNAGETLKRAFDYLQIPYVQTDKGNPSFSKPNIKNIKHPFVDKILEIRHLIKMRDTFIKSYIIDKSVNGKIHCSFHPLKGDDGGARSGRFSSSDPNLQNIPIRSEEGKIIRQVFLDKYKDCTKVDYSQIEYRLLAHHAVGPRSDEIRERYNNNPDTDYHDETSVMIKEILEIVLGRRDTKTINFGLTYGMGKNEIINRLGEGADNVYKAYHKAVPFVLATMKAAQAEAQSTGIVRTILNRASDFPMWTSTDWSDRSAYDFDTAVEYYGYENIERAFTHKALNRKLQGGAADIMKKAMLDAWNSGIFSATGIPSITCHDELDFWSDLPKGHKVWADLKYILENAIKLRVPVIADFGHGPSWGDAD